MRINNSFNNFAIQNMHSLLLQRGSMQASNALNRSPFSADNRAQFFSPFLNSDSFQYVNTIKSASSDLSGAITSLSRDAFAGRSASSSDTEAVTARFTGFRSGPSQSLSVKVGQLATSQVSKGDEMQSDDAYAGDTGMQRFAIEIGGRTTNLSVNVEDGDTNQEVQQRMADSINNAGIGVRATVETDSESGTSTLRIESSNTGERSAFTIRDREDGGNLVEQTGIGNEDSVTQEAGNSIYTVDGRTRESATNTVDLGGGLSATFNSTTDEAVNVSLGADPERVKTAVQDFVSSYNELYTAALSNSGDPRAERLASNLLRTARTSMGSLSDVGIGFDGTGRMSINNDKLSEASNNGRLEQFFTENSGRNYGFSNQLQRIADNVSRNPASFVTNPLFGGGFGSNNMYSNFGSSSQFTFFNSGWMFDFML